MTDQNTAGTEVRVGVQNLAPTFTYMHDGSERTIKMSFGLLTILMQRIGSYENVGLVGTDPTVNDIILRILLTERDHKGKPLGRVEKQEDGSYKEGPPKEMENIFEVEVSPEDMEGLLFFAQAHMADFSMRALSRVAALHESTKPTRERLSSLARGLLGSVEGPLKNSSASPSTPPTAS